MEKIKEELKEIRKELAIAIFSEDMLYAKMMLNKLDTVIYNLESITKQRESKLPHNPPNRCKECGKFYKIPMHAPVGETSCECKKIID